MIDARSNLALYSDMATKGEVKAQLEVPDVGNVRQFQVVVMTARDPLFGGKVNHNNAKRF